MKFKVGDRVEIICNFCENFKGTIIKRSIFFNNTWIIRRENSHFRAFVHENSMKKLPKKNEQLLLFGV